MLRLTPNDFAHLRTFVETYWEKSALPELIRYVTIPNVTPKSDPNWHEHGYMERALELFSSFLSRVASRYPGTQLDPRVNHAIFRLPGRTPLLVANIPGTAPGNVLFYGHLDKQPASTGWRDGLSPWTGIREGDRLYGRGGADDGYALFAALGAILALGDLGIPFPSCRILIEASEESGSPDLPAYLADAEVGSYLGTPDAVICLDSGCKTYNQLWLTTSLRGLISATLRVGVLVHSVHSGDGGGIVPSPHRIVRALLARIEDATTGDILLPELHTTPSTDTRQTVQETYEAVGGQIYRTFPFLPGVCPVYPNVRQLILNNTHLPTLEIIGVEGVPGLDGGNTIAPWVAHKLSVRLPPTCDVRAAAEALHKALTKNPPYGAQISCTIDSVSPGWSGRRLTPDLEEVLTRASYFFYGEKLACMGEGAGIPFVNMMATRFPEATLVVTGLLGPESNAHGPNEMLHIPAAKALTGSMAVLLASLAMRQNA